VQTHEFWPISSHLRLLLLLVAWSSDCFHLGSGSGLGVGLRFGFDFAVTISCVVARFVRTERMRQRGKFVVDIRVRMINWSNSLIVVSDSSSSSLQFLFTEQNFVTDSFKVFLLVNGGYLQEFGETNGMKGWLPFSFITWCRMS
jgi:hypothetical protein